MHKQMINYPHVASMVFNTPLYATVDVLAGVKAVLIPRLTGRTVEDIGLDVEDSMGISEDSAPQMSTEERELKSLTIRGGIAVIKVHGVLVARRGTIDSSCSELISYERLRNQITAALNSGQVEEIVMDFHSGGGSAMGCKELADFIREATKIKPITALVNFAAYSAAYFLASACSKIICSPTAGVGSIGVIMETFEVSKFEEEIGIKYNTFYRGARKNDFSSHEPITEEAIAEIDGKLDTAYRIFTESVANYRDLSVDTVINTEAKLLDADEAKQIGLVDEIMPAQDAINQIAEKYINSTATPSIGMRAAAINAQNQL